jgi:hypothetical protein
VLQVQRRLLSLLAGLHTEPLKAPALRPPCAPSTQPKAAQGSSAQEQRAALENVGAVRELQAAASSPESRAEALCCYGHAVCQARAVGGSSSDPSDSEGVAEQFLGTLEECCHPRNPEDVRRAAVHALAASQLLALTPAGREGQPDAWRCEEVQARAWCCAVTLMEDEDSDVRQV